MRVIRLTDISLVSTNAPGSSYPEWSPSSNYAIGDRVQFNAIFPAMEYMAIKASGPNNGGAKQPDLYPDYWYLIGAINSHAMFDTYTNSQTIIVGQDLQVTIQCSNASVIGAFFVQGAKSVSLRQSYKGEVVYEELDRSLRSINEPSWYEYFLGVEVYFSDITWRIVPYSISTVQMTFHCINPSTPVKVGVLCCGTASQIGHTLVEPKIGILDYSRKITDDEGKTFLRQGRYSREITATIYVDTKFVDIVRRVFEAVRGTPAIFDFNNEIDDMTTDYDSAVVYGFFEDFYLVISNPTLSTANIVVKGLT